MKHLFCKSLYVHLELFSWNLESNKVKKKEKESVWKFEIFCIFKNKFMWQRSKNTDIFLRLHLCGDTVTLKCGDGLICFPLRNFLFIPSTIFNNPKTKNVSVCSYSIDYANVLTKTGNSDDQSFNCKLCRKPYCSYVFQQIWSNLGRSKMWLSWDPKCVIMVQALLSELCWCNKRFFLGGWLLAITKWLYVSVWSKQIYIQARHFEGFKWLWRGKQKTGSLSVS